VSEVSDSEDDDGPPLTEEDELIVDEMARQVRERRHVPAAVHDAERFRQEFRARRIAVTQIDAHPRVKIALLMAERLRYLALRTDAFLTFLGDPTGTTDEAGRLVLAPLLRELEDLSAPFEGSQERQRDKLIDLVEWAATLLKTTDDESEWARVISTLRFEMQGTFLGLGQHLTDADLRQAITVFLPKRGQGRKKAQGLPKWDELAALVRRARLGNVPSETIRTEHTRRRSARRKQREAEQEALTKVPLRSKWDGLEGEAGEAVKKQILAIEAQLLHGLRRSRKDE
jgi:hypothetical protein